MDLRHSTHERAVEVIQAAGNPVCLLVQSLVHLVRPRHDQEYRCTPVPFHPHLLRIFSHCISIIVDYLTIWFSYRIVDDLGVYNWQFELFKLILQCSYIILYRYGSSVSAVVVDILYWIIVFFRRVPSWNMKNTTEIFQLKNLSGIPCTMYFVITLDMHKQTM